MRRASCRASVMGAKSSYQSHEACIAGQQKSSGAKATDPSCLRCSIQKRPSGLSLFGGEEVCRLMATELGREGGESAQTGHGRAYTTPSIESISREKLWVVFG